MKHIKKRNSQFNSTQNSQEDKEKKMENIIEDKDRISTKINEFQKKYQHHSSDDNDNAKSSAFGLAMRMTQVNVWSYNWRIMGWSFR